MGDTPQFNVLLLGSGGREHALAWKIAQSPLLGQLYIAPGNPGTASVGTNLDLQDNDFEAVEKAIREKQIDLLVIGPEAPLVDGLVDFLDERDGMENLKVIGPGKTGAQLEGSKAFAKEFMKNHGIPTAAYSIFDRSNIPAAKEFIDRHQPPFVLKADGLAAGKGVLIIHDREEAKAEVVAMLSGKFGAASQRIVIEEFLTGIELSVFILTDGRAYALLPEAKDYKRIGEGDTGLNTGGMGSISPVPFADSFFMDRVKLNVIEPTLKGLKEEGIDYKGFIFFGLMNVDGVPYVIEYNARMGDPETQVVMPRIESDFLELLVACAKGNLDEKQVEISDMHAASVILVSGGYPEKYEKGKAIMGLSEVEGSTIFHAGTRMTGGNLTTSGGRVMAVCSLAETRQAAVQKSYENAARIRYEGMYYRSDIGFDL